MCLQEIKADNIDCISIKKFAHDHGYKAFCKIRKKFIRKSGGLCTLVSNDIVNSVKVIDTKLETVQWLCIGKKLLGLDKDLLLGNVYLPPPNSPYASDDMFSELEMNLLELNYINFHVMLVGDLNAHTLEGVDYIDLQDDVREDLGLTNCTDVLKIHGCKVNRSNKDKTKCDQYGKKLLELCKTTGLCIFNGRLRGDESGSYTTTKNTTIDYVIGTPDVLQFVQKMNVEDFDEVFSDVHRKILVTFKAMLDTNTNNEESIAKKLKQWTNEKQNEFIGNIEDIDLLNITELLHEEGSSVNEINNKITKVLMSSAERTLGYRESPLNRKQLGNKECRNKKRVYNRAIKKLKYDKSSENLQQKRKACREYKAAVKKFQKQKNKRFLKKLEEVRGTNSYVYWKMLNKKPHNITQPSIDQLEQHFRALNDVAIDTTEIETNNLEKRNYDDLLLNEPITENEVISACKKLKNNKSPGEDGIINEYLKASITKMVGLYTAFFNKILDDGVYPEMWSKGLIIPIYKNKGDRKDPNNYRGITLLSCVGKLFTSVLNERLKAYCATNNIINENQAGFRSKYSTTDHIFSLKVLVDLFFRSKQKLYCAFVDYMKAFDTVWRDGLWHKLHQNGISKTSKVYKIIVNMYDGIKSCVFSANEKTNYFTSNAGVRQGENLSPLLFSLFINDLEEYLVTKGNEFLNFKDERCNDYLRLLVLLYADDTIVLSNSPAGLQKGLNDLSNYCNLWKLQVNSSKTKVVIFSKRKPKKLPVFKYHNNVLEIVDEFKYLGVIFKSNGYFKSCKLHLKEQATKAMFALLSKGRVLQLPVDVMLELFDKTVLPIMLYGCEIWGFGNNNMLDTVLLKFCKYLLGLKASTPNCMVYGELGCLPVHISIKMRMVGYWLKVMSSDDNRICKKFYNILFDLHESNLYESDWLTCVQDILQENNLGYIWQAQDVNVNQAFVKNELKEQLRSGFIKDWKAAMFHSSKCSFYKEIKTSFRLEPYLYKVPKSVWRYIVKFRCSNHKLPIETGRYINVDRHMRHCQKCNLEVLGDEYHIFFECNSTDIVSIRRKFIPLNYRKNQNRSMYNFVCLMKMVDDIKIAKHISSFIKLCDIM